MKKCIKCRKSKNNIQFKRKGRKNTNVCRDCRLEISKQHYEQNKKVYIKRAADYKRKIQAYIQSVKANTPCKDCKILYPPYVMDFDHVRGNKKFILSQCPRVGGMKAVKEEIAKCELVCSNCHRLRTHGGL